MNILYPLLSFDYMENISKYFHIRILLLNLYRLFYQKLISQKLLFYIIR